jgi:hypothetical protein
MRATISLAVLVLALGGTAAARGPTLEELPTVKELMRLAAEKIEAQRRAAEEARKDPKADRIEAYRTGVTSIWDWKEIAEILKDDKEEDSYRLAASNALRERFKDMDRGNTEIANLMKRIGIDLHKKLNDKDEKVRIWVHNVFRSFWPGKAQVINFKPEETNYRTRFNAFKEWREFLME